jgi:hypothetical protein
MAREVEVEYVPGGGPKLKHVKKLHDDGCELPFCPLCDGALFECSVCHATEGTLTTDCPGMVMVSKLQDAVMEGRLDYKDGFWIDPRKAVAVKKEESTLTLVGDFMGVELYADTAMAPGEWKLVSLTGDQTCSQNR